MLGFGSSGERRQALVIGNSRYGDAGILPAAGNDAEGVARALARLGFHVRFDIDCDHAKMVQLFDDFDADLSKDVAKVGLFYYSGHGVQIDGRNYLMPIGAESSAGADFGKLIEVEPLIDRMADRVETRLVVLDACRNNPFAERLSAGVLRTRGYYVGDSQTPIRPSGGLAEIRAKAGTFIAFAASPGGVALEAPGETYSKFTTGLLRHIEATDVPLGNLMMRITDYVYTATNGRQNSWAHSSLRAPFFFNPGSLIMLVGNVIGLAAFMASWLPYSFSLYAAALPAFALPSGERLSFSWVVVDLAIAMASLGLFLAGLQRAYRLLRGEPDASGPSPHGDGGSFRVQWRQGVFGGFFGGMIAAPIITTAYYYAWKAMPYADDPLPFGLLLTEITIACVVIGVLLGLFALSFSEYFGRLGSRSPQMAWLVNPFTGAVVGGLVAGIICGPWTTLYFGLQWRPFVLPHILLLGAVPGTAVMIFSIVNYSLERINPRRLARSGLAALGSVLVVGAVAGALGWITRNLIQAIADSVPMESTAILIAGLPYGVALGIALGAVFGLTVVGMAALERATAM